MNQLFEAESFKDLYPCSSKQWFEKNRLSKLHYAIMQDIIDSVEIKQNQIKSVLDWGCGNLMWAIGLFLQAEITGIETSKENLGFACLNAEKNNVKFNPLEIEQVDLLEDESFDIAMAFALIEHLSDEQFEHTFKTIYNALKRDGKLICTFHNWRKFSALYIRHLFTKDAYNKYCTKLGYIISKKTLIQVENDFIKLGYKVMESGAFNPNCPGFWNPVRTRRFYRTRNKVLSHWYCTQYIILSKH